MKNIIKRPLSKTNTWMMKKYKVGMVVNYPLRTSVEFVKKKFGGKLINIAEIGAYKGENALNMFESLNIKRAYLIDPYEVYEGYEKDPSSKNVNKNFKSANKRLRKYKDRVTFIKKYSSNAFNDIPNELDFIYIDGNHDYEYMKEDIENYWNKLKEGGVLAGHDISFPGVSKAFCEFVSKNKLEPNIQGMDWWVIK